MAFGIALGAYGAVNMMRIQDGLVMELDASDSFSTGSASLWRNMVASPADGESQSTYDMDRNSVALTGSGMPFWESVLFL